MVSEPMFVTPRQLLLVERSHKFSFFFGVVDLTHGCPPRSPSLVLLLWTSVAICGREQEVGS